MFKSTISIHDIPYYYCVDLDLHPELTNNASIISTAPTHTWDIVAKYLTKELVFMVKVRFIPCNWKSNFDVVVGYCNVVTDFNICTKRASFTEI